MEGEVLWIKRPAILVVLTFLLTLKRGDAELCVFSESCILPCSFTSGDETLIHWVHGPENTPVHSYYHNEDQLSRQGQRFKGRTSLFKDQISGGNASLQLVGVEVQDQGRYKCYTSTITGNKELFIDLNVEAPVQKVNIQLVEKRITCSSEGMYPEPELTWSTSPPSSVSPPDKPTVQRTERQLYKISSFLIPSNSSNDVSYSCTVSADRSERKATFLKTTAISFSKTEKTEIPCTPLNTPWTSIIWSFNHSQIILNKSKINVTVSEEWRQQVKGVSESGSLTLQGLSSNQQGIYTCELSNGLETFVTNNLLVENLNQGRSNVAGIAVGVIIAILVLALVGFYKRKFILEKCNNGKRNRKRGKNGSAEEMRLEQSKQKAGETKIMLPEQQDGVTRTGNGN